MERKSSLGLFVICLASLLVLAACGGGRSGYAAGSVGASGTNGTSGSNGTSGTNGTTGAKGTTGAAQTTSIGPELLSEAEIRAAALRLGQPFYWAGPKDGYDYELMRTTNDRVYVAISRRESRRARSPGNS
ncbi:MAG TPA: hypothetical protein VGH79_09940 [Gaiellaceae bacterium]